MATTMTHIKEWYSKAGNPGDPYYLSQEYAPFIGGATYLGDTVSLHNGFVDNRDLYNIYTDGWHPGGNFNDTGQGSDFLHYIQSGGDTSWVSIVFGNHISISLKSRNSITTQGYFFIDNNAIAVDFNKYNLCRVTFRTYYVGGLPSVTDTNTYSRVTTSATLSTTGIGGDMYSAPVSGLDEITGLTYTDFFSSSLLSGVRYTVFYCSFKNSNSTLLERIYSINNIDLIT